MYNQGRGSGGRDYAGGRDGNRRDSRGSNDSRDSRYSNQSRSSRGGFGTGRQAADDSRTIGINTLQSMTLNDMVRMPPPREKAVVAARLNAYEMNVSRAKPIYQFDLEWMATNVRGRVFNLVEARGATQQEKGQMMRQLFCFVIQRDATFFQPDIPHLFDSGRMLFHQKQLLPLNEQRIFDIDYQDVPLNIREFFGRMENIKLTVQATREVKFTDLNNLNDLKQTRPLIQYLELLFRQTQLNNDDFVHQGTKTFNKKEARIEQSPYVLKEGVDRGVRMVDTKTGLIQMLPKLKVFFPNCPMYDIIDYIVEGRDIWRGSSLKHASDILKGVWVVTTHLQKNRKFQCAGLSDKRADEIIFDMDGKEISVADYFQEKYKMKLRYHDFPCAINKKGKDKHYFPIELLRLIPDQPVPKTKMSNDLNAKVIRQCQKLPSKFIEDLERQRDVAQIQNANPIIKASGIRVEPTRLVGVNAQLLEPPSICYQQTQKVLSTGVWGMLNTDLFFEPAHIRKLYFILADERMDTRKAENFCRQLLERARCYGMRIDGDPIYKTWERFNSQTVMRELTKYSEEGCTFAFVIGDSDDLHHSMKFSELSTKLVTQNVKTRTVDRANNSLYDNLVFKMNLKASGINYELMTSPVLAGSFKNVDALKTLTGDTLFFGISLSHPGPQSQFDRFKSVELTDPTTIGFASNKLGGSTNMSKGDFGYQKTRLTTVEPKLLKQKFESAVLSYFRNTGRYPKWIIVYRAGLSEGEIDHIREIEVVVFKELLSELVTKNPEFIIPKLTVIVANRMTTYRVLPDRIDSNQKAPQQNCQPGTCVSEKLNNSLGRSFLLVAQRALMGTANPSYYTIVEDSSGLHFDYFKILTFSLCFGHGIVTSPTALPCPIVSAADLAKRAKNNFKNAKDENADDVSMASGDSARFCQNAGDVLTEDEKNNLLAKESMHFERLNLVFKASIDETRFWA